MLRFNPIDNARQAEHYYSKSDGGYYLQADDLHREWGGKGAAMLGLSGPPDYEQFKRLIHGLDPHSGEQLTAKLIDDRVPGWDVTASVPKGVTTALERGDDRIRDVIWAAGRKAMAELEELATTRVRKDGKQEDRLTGNLTWYATEHPETRPTKADGMPDWDRHIHFVVFNETFDPVEQEWKAVKFRPIMDLRKWFSTRFDMYVSRGLTNLGYEIETKYRSDGSGGRKYYSWDIKGIPDSVLKNFSRRSAEVDATEKKILQAMKEAEGYAPDSLSPVARDKLGATSRLHKRDDLTLADYRDYWNSRVTPEEGLEIAETILGAREGLNPKPANTVDKAVDRAIQHVFERNSVVDWRDLAIAAMERSMGAGLPDDILPEARRQGVLLKNGEATTREVLAEEGRIIDFARGGRGAMPPLRENGLEGVKSPLALSDEQAAMVNHVLKSPDQTMLVVGDAGTGKTRSVRAAFAAIDRPIAIIAPSADASRGVLRDEGFKSADTVAAFLGSPERQAAVKDGVIWVDEAGLLPIKDLAQLVTIAEQQQARLVVQGDPKQHKAVARHGNMMNVLQEFAGLPVGRLSEIWRQENNGYKRAVAAIAQGDMLGGYDLLDKLGWVQQVDGHQELVEEYVTGVKEGKSQLVVAPTHKEGDAITAEIRARLKQEQKLGQEDKAFPQLKPLNWTEAEKADPLRYDGSEIIQFHRNSGSFRAGQRVAARELLPQLGQLRPGHFSVYAEGTVGLAQDDVIRITSNGWTKDRKHRLDNGYTSRIARITPGGDIELANGWLMGKDFGHLTHGYVSTSHASQGKTVDRVLVAMGQGSLPAINREQVYVSISRGREKAVIFTDLAPDDLRRAMQRSDQRKSATELMAPRVATKPPKLRDKARAFVQRMRDRYRILRDRVRDGITEAARQPERGDYGLAR